MTLRRLIVFIVGLQLSVFAFAAPAIAQRRVTTTLLPVKAESTPPGSGDKLKISANGSDPIQPTSTALLTFDPRGIPQQATITAATLRMVGNSNVANPQLVRVTVGSQQDSIGQWTAAPGKSVFSTSSDSMRQLVATKVQARDSVALTLTSRSRLSDWDYYALSETAYPSSYKPRLIVEYELPSSPDDLPEYQTTTRTFWRFLSDPKDVRVKPFFRQVSFISNPAFYQGDVYLFGSPSSQETNLYDVAPGGAQRWSTAIKDVPGANALTTDTGLLYSIGENRIVSYDLNRQGAKGTLVSVPDLKLTVPPTLGADGSLYFVPSGNGYAYGLNPDLKEIWRYPAQEGARAETVSRITLSPVAQHFAYLLTRRDKKNALVRINATDGSADVVTLSDTYIGFHRPVVVKGPEQDYVVVAAFSQSDGMLSVYSAGELRWANPGTVSQPTTDRAGQRVFAVQKGRFQVYDILNGNVVCTSAATGPALEATSNLITDGDDNVYFWNNGRLLAFRNNCQPLFERGLGGLPRELDLMFSQDGTLYARTGAQQVFSLTPTQTLLVLDQSQVQTNTVYAADTLRTADNLTLKSDVRVVFKAEKDMSFGPGFSVALGARLRCQIGL